MSGTPEMEDRQEKSYKVWSDSTHITQTGLPPARLITQPVSHLSRPINVIHHPPTTPPLPPSHLHPALPSHTCYMVPSPSDTTVINQRERSSDATCIIDSINSLRWDICVAMLVWQANSSFSLHLKTAENVL